MLKRLIWIAGFAILVMVLVLLSGCAADPPKATVPAGSAIVTGPAAYRATILNAPERVAFVSVDNQAVPACTDSLTPPCWQQSGSTVRINGLAHGREKEEGRVYVTITDSGGRVTGATAIITGWGRIAR